MCALTPHLQTEDECAQSMWAAGGRVHHLPLVRTSHRQNASPLHLLLPPRPEHLRTGTAIQQQVTNGYISQPNSLQNIYIVLFGGLQWLNNSKFQLYHHKSKSFFTPAALFKIWLSAVSLP